MATTVSFTYGTSCSMSSILAWKATGHTYYWSLVRLRIKVHRRTLKRRDWNGTLIQFCPNSCFSYENLALQDYSNKAPDDELATVPCLDIEAW